MREFTVCSTVLIYLKNLIEDISELEFDSDSESESREPPNYLNNYFGALPGTNGSQENPQAVGLTVYLG